MKRLETMMIHTTQNLASLRRNYDSTNAINPYLNKPDYLESRNLFSMPMEANNDSISFKAKKPDAKEVKRVIKSISKKVGEIKEKASPEVKKGDKVLKSPFFNKILNVVDYETVAQAAIAAFACAARGGTILAMSNEENKANNTYAVSHAFASGLVGLVTVFALTAPFKAGSDHVMKNMLKNLKEDTLRRLYPQLDLASRFDKAGNLIEDPKLWKNIKGAHDKVALSFCKDVRNCQMMPKPKNLAEVSIETLEKVLNVHNVDWAAQKGKSFNDVVTKDGKNLYDIIDFNNLSIKFAFEEVSTVTGKTNKSSFDVLLRDLDKKVFEDLISKADDASPWKKLDLNSVYDDLGNVKDFRQWKEVGTGKQWMLDLDSVQVSSPLETYEQVLRSDGRLRFDAKEGIHKLRTRQPNAIKDENGIEGLGTEITDEMIKADKENAGLLKSLTWFPDLVFRIPVALTTVSLIPWILKSVFGVEKKKPVQQQEKPVEVVEANLEDKNVEKENVSFKGINSSINNKNNENNLSFKASGAKESKGILDWFGKIIGENLSKHLIESETMAKISAKLSDIPGGLTQAMSAFGALLTSSAYVYGTITNKNLEEDKRRTLAINQTLCFIVPTIAAYTVDRVINEKVKSIERRYGNLNRGEAAMLIARGEMSKADGLIKDLGKKIAGIRVLASLTVFTVIYRYLTPVLITPIANKIGDKINAKRAEKQAAQAKVA